MSHYFKNDETLKSQTKTIKKSTPFGELLFQTDSGVFSKNETDQASELLVENINQISGDILDLGCGYGFIGIYIAKKFQTLKLNLTFTDINQRAISLTTTNLKLNGITAETIVSDGFQNIKKTFDTILLNPPIRAGKETMFKLYRQSFQNLNDKGALYIVIQERHGAKSSLKELVSIFTSCEIIYKKKGYYVIKSIK